MQIRGQTDDRAVCPDISWMEPDFYFPWSNGSSAIPSELFKASRLPFQYDAQILDPSDPVALGKIVETNTVDDSLGNVSLCYYDRIDKTSFGPLGPSAKAERTSAAAAVYVPSVECYPECPGPTVAETGSGDAEAGSGGSGSASVTNYTGLLPAFVYQTREELGEPWPTVPSFEDAADGGFALTLPSNLTFFQLRTILTGLIENSWLDRQVRADRRVSRAHGQPVCPLLAPYGPQSLSFASDRL